MTRDEEIASLKARVEQLERANKPQPPPDLSDWKPINPIDRVSMPPSVMREMAEAIPTDMVREIAMRDGRGPQGPSSVLPPSQQSTTRTRVVGNGTGWAREIPLGPQPGIDLIDRGVNAALPHGPGWGKQGKR
jgi:hypothetical protein